MTSLGHGLFDCDTRSRRPQPAATRSSSIPRCGWSAAGTTARRGPAPLRPA